MMKLKRWTNKVLGYEEHAALLYIREYLSRKENAYDYLIRKKEREEVLSKN